MTTPTPPPPAKSTATGWAALGLLIACPVLFVGGWLYNALSGGSSGSNDSGARAACRVYVEDRLRAPSTAEFSGLEATAGDRGRWTVTGSVDAQNGFGAQVRSDFTCVVEYNGGDWLLVRITGLR